MCKTLHLSRFYPAVQLQCRRGGTNTKPSNQYISQWCLYTKTTDKTMHFNTRWHLLNINIFVDYTTMNTAAVRSNTVCVLRYCSSTARRNNARDVKNYSFGQLLFNNYFCGSNNNSFKWWYLISHRSLIYCTCSTRWIKTKWEFLLRFRRSSMMQRTATSNNTPVDMIIIPWPPNFSLKPTKKPLITVWPRIKCKILKPKSKWLWAVFY